MFSATVASDVLTEERNNEMKKLTTTKQRTQAGPALDERYETLKQMLISRQRQLLDDLQGEIRRVRDDGAHQRRAGQTPGDTPDVDPQDDLQFALIQMKAETAQKISDALVRLEEGTYGLCFECDEQIAQPRLRALPFALRCKDCEEANEMAQQRERAQARRPLSALGFEMRD
jgi:DnaK suppressor protein